MKYISPKHIENMWGYQESPHAHPEPVCKSSKGKGYDEGWEKRGYENDERFCGEKIKEEPHYPCEEGGGCGPEIVQEIGCD